MARHDDTFPPHPVLTDQPGLILTQPRRQLAKILILYALLPLVCSASGAVIVYELSNAATERRVAAVEDYLAQRREANTAADSARDRQLEQTRRDLCVVLDRIQPRDAAVQDMRRRYGCTTGPTSPSPSPTPSARTRPAPTGGATERAPANGQRGRSGSDGAAGPTGPSGPPGKPGKPAPSPTPPAQAPPADESTDLLDVCVPLLRLCV